MADKKDTKKTVDETPKLVEVYGDEIREAEPENTDFEVKEEKDKFLESGEDKKEERESFKTEVVDFEINDGKSKKEDKKEKKVVKTEDEMAFEEEIGGQKESVKGVYNVGVIIFLVIFGITGWAFYLKSVWTPGGTESEVIAESEATTKTTPTPVPTPTPLERSEIVLDVLNGSGETGLAGKTATIFEDLGYSIDTVGNAETADENMLYIKEEKIDKLTVLYEDVLEELQISSPSGYLDEDETADAQIVLGK